jgi:murein DD-endopeptidase MepM/ murein hydrolase activator NlpD
VTYGQIIGYVGSTGRSTGPHMHYETRVDGEAVDPQKFLRAGIRLGSAL